MIIKDTTSNKDLEVYNLQYPDTTVSEKKKTSKEYIKSTLDYFWSVGVKQIMANKNTFAKNYDLVKGTLRPEDFYQQEDVPSFYEQDVENIIKHEEALPAYVQDFSIIQSPINILKGEQARRPENVLVKAMDDDSQAQELNYRTDTLKDYVTSLIANNVLLKAAKEGMEVSEEDLQQITAKEIEEKLGSYTSHVERWGARVLDSLKLRLNLKEKGDEAFDDLLKIAREKIHIFEDNSTLGLNLEVLNPVNTFDLTTPGKKYISDPLDEINGAYASGFINIMEISEIIHRYSLTKEEVDHLHKIAKDGLPIAETDSNLFHPEAKGIDSIKYTTYNRLAVEEKMFIDNYLNESPSSDDFINFPNTISTVYGNKFTVMQVYWSSLVRVGKLTYIDENEQITSTPVDENYKSGMHPTEIDLTWGYVRQWWKGTRIGPDIYKDVEPFQLLEYCPIIGVVYEPKNLSKVKSFVDMLKPFQVMCNIYMNKLHEMIQKDLGNIVLTSLRTIPKGPDDTHEDVLDRFIEKCKAEGLMFVDDSPANTNGPSGFNQYTVLQASRAPEMQAYFNLYQMIKMEAWALVGINPERQGLMKGDQTATGVNTAMSQSYSQTESWFTQHEYFMNKVYQALLDAAQYVESHNETSTISYLTNEFDSGAIAITGEDLKLKDLWVFVTSRSEDNQNLQQLKMLSQSMLQNGASPYDVMLLQTSKSTRYVQDAFKRIEDRRQAMEQQAQEIEQQKLEQQQAQFEQQQEILLQQHQADIENENYNKELDRQSKERVALISATARGEVTPPDEDNSGVPDVFEGLKVDLQRTKLDRDHAAKQRELAMKQMEVLNRSKNEEENRKLKREELDVKREDIEAKKYVARINRNPGDKKK